MARTRLACLVLACGTLGCAGSDRSEPAAGSEPVPVIHWDEGRSYDYDLQMRANSELVSAGTPPWGFSLSGQLQLVREAPLATDSQRLWLRASIRAPKVTSEGIATEALAPMEAELAAPFAIAFEAGRVVALKVDPSVTGQTMALLRTIVASLQTPPIAGAASVREYDATGEYEARYTVSQGQVQRQKLRYVSMLTVGATLGAKSVPRVLEASASLRLRDGRSVDEASVDERYEMMLPSGATMRVRNRMTLVSTDSGAAEGPPRLAEAAVEVPASQPFGNSARRDRFDDVRIAGRTLPEVLDALAAGAGSGDDATMDAFSAVVALARKDSANIVGIVAKAEASPEHARRLFDALASAGTPEAQRALIALVDDPGASAESRRAAARSLIRVQTPIDEQVQLLMRLTRDEALRDHGIYGLGTAARRLREANEPARSSAIGNVLSGLLAEAPDDAQRMRVLRGIANAADASLFTRVRPYLSAESFGVREAAVFALQRMPGDEVDRSLVERLNEEKHDSVRTAVARAFRHRAPSDALVTAIERAARRDPNTHVRYAALVTMGRWVGEWPQLRRALEDISRNDTEPKLRREAERLLASTPDAG